MGCPVREDGARVPYGSVSRLSSRSDLSLVSSPLRLVARDLEEVATVVAARDLLATVVQWQWLHRRLQLRVEV